MSNRVNVTVSEDQKTMQIEVGPPFGLRKMFSIDLTDAHSIVAGIGEAVSLSNEAIQGQLAQLMKRVEALEKLSKNDKAVAAASQK